jgi:hypothetical protein
MSDSTAESRICANFSAADISVLPSRGEDFSNAVDEAMRRLFRSLLRWAEREENLLTEKLTIEVMMNQIAGAHPHPIQKRFRRPQPSADKHFPSQFQLI